MSSWAERLTLALFAAATLVAGSAAQAQATYPGIGRTATPAEVAAWDIDVRPDFTGLPAGAGSVAQGQVVWEDKCASCHGIFGESNQFFSPLIGGTSAADVASGRVARLNDPGFPGRTTMMKLPTLSTLWDYIRRAMPWTAPKSLSNDEVYAVTAWMLNAAGVVPDSFVLSDANIRAVQQRLPNRKGMSTDHGLWPGKGLGNGGRPDVVAKACMTQCDDEPRITSALPDFARNQHGNLAEQQRLVGPQHGADTALRSAAVAPLAPLAAPVAAATANAATPSSTVGDRASTNRGASAGADAAAFALAQKHNCTACHGLVSKIVGPAFRDIAARHGARPDAEAHLAARIQAGSQGVWGPIPMPAQDLPATDLQQLARWLAAGARQ